MDVPSVHEAVGAQHEASQEGGAVVVGGAYDASAIPATEVPLGQDHVHVHYVPTPVPAPVVHATHHYVSSPVPAVHVTQYVPAPAPAQVTHHYVTAPAVHVTHHYVPAPAPEPHVKTIVHKHYRTVYRSDRSCSPGTRNPTSLQRKAGLRLWKNRRSFLCPLHHTH